MDSWGEKHYQPSYGDGGGYLGPPGGDPGIWGRPEPPINEPAPPGQPTSQGGLPGGSPTSGQATPTASPSQAAPPMDISSMWANLNQTTVLGIGIGWIIIAGLVYFFVIKKR